ncbi:MAG: hypothetical protein AB8H86_19110 [Polyangiales bacterium]
MKKTLFLTLLAAMAFGCGDDDMSTDTGPATDTGALADTSTADDTGPADDAGPMDDAGPGDLCPDLMPTQGGDNLVISQYDVASGEIEFFNPTDGDIGLDGFVLCSRPQYETIDGSGITVPAGGYATYVASAGFMGASSTSGELALYDSPMYGSRNAMIDFVCWGDAPGSSRKSVAERMMGSEVLWTGDCAAALTNVVARNIGTDGIEASDYSAPADFAEHTCE